jgi:hypothetical protein
MRRPVLRALLPVLLIWLLAACTAAPAIVVEPAAYDFGGIRPTEPASATLAVRNAGDSDLEITGVSTSCGCTTANLSRTALASGETADLKITFDPQAHPGLYGPLLRIVYLESNDPTQPELEIPVTVDVLQPEEAES